MTRAWISLLGVLGIVTTSCLGFAINRSDTGLSGLAILPGPIFKADRRASIEMFLNGKIHAADVDNILRDIETKKPAKEEEKCSSCSEEPQRVRRSDNVLHNQNQTTINDKNTSEVNESTSVLSSSSEPRTSVVNESTTVLSSSWEPRTSDVTSEKSSESEVPRNVVFLLVDNAAPDRKSMWKRFGAGHEFSHRGFLQNCHSNGPSEGSKFSLGESLVSGGSDECECDRFLRANVGSLLSWARHVKEMTTGAVSATNFSIPSPLGYERLPSQVAKQLEDNDEMHGLKQDTRRYRSDLKGNSRLIDLQKQSRLSSSTPTVIPETATKTDGLNGFDGTWDLFDMFSRIRMAFFRILLESLGNLSGSEDEFSGRRPFPVQSSVIELVSDTVREIRSVPNDEGFMMVVAAPGNELSDVVKVLQSAVSAEDTLLVVAGMCSENNEPVPFFANGPGGKALQEVRTIWDLPGSIRGVISNGCHGEHCKNKRHAEPLALHSLELLSIPHDPPHKRIGRSKEEDEATLLAGDDKSTKDSGDAENNSDEKTAVPEMEKRSGAQISRVDNVAAILGILTSITAMLALNS